MDFINSDNYNFLKQGAERFIAKAHFIYAYELIVSIFDVEVQLKWWCWCLQEQTTEENFSFL